VFAHGRHARHVAERAVILRQKNGGGLFFAAPVAAQQWPGVYNGAP